MDLWNQNISNSTSVDHTWNELLKYFFLNSACGKCRNGKMRLFETLILLVHKKSYRWKLLGKRIHLFSIKLFLTQGITAKLSHYLDIYYTTYLNNKLWKRRKAEIQARDFWEHPISALYILSALTGNLCMTVAVEIKSVSMSHAIRRK